MKPPVYFTLKYVWLGEVEIGAVGTFVDWWRASLWEHDEDTLLELEQVEYLKQVVQQSLHIALHSSDARFMLFHPNENR